MKINVKIHTLIIERKPNLRTSIKQVTVSEEKIHSYHSELSCFFLSAFLVLSLVLVVLLMYLFLSFHS